MSIRGTDAYVVLDDLPAIVAKAAVAAAAAGFGNSCRPEHGRLLRVLAGGAGLRIGESGTGYGVGVAWMLAGQQRKVPIVSVERDGERAEAARKIHADADHVRIVDADWTALYDH